jgi:hypothetical protein
LGNNECCSLGSASDDCKKTYKGAVDILGCFERWAQVLQGEFEAFFVKSAAVKAGVRHLLTRRGKGFCSKRPDGPSIFLSINADALMPGRVKWRDKPAATNRPRFGGT